MMGGLAATLLTGRQSFLPLAIIGSVLVWLGMLLFVIVVWRAR
jgi:hypothetical protein